MDETEITPGQPSGEGTGLRTFRALRHRNFRLYWSGQIVSLIGTWMQIVAQGWLVYRLTDSPFMLGLVNIVGLLPVVPVSLLAGVISDRLPRRNLILVTETVLMVQAFVLAALTWLGIVQIWHVVVLSFVLGAASALEQPARLAFVVDTVGKEDLSNAVALNASVYNAARIVGPAIAGVLVAWIGEAGCFLINGASFLAIILALLAMRLPRQVRNKERLRVVGSLANGLRYTWNSHDIRSMMVIVALSSFLILPYIALMPAFADVLELGPEEYGFLMTGVGIGAIAGALFVAGIRSGRRGRWLTLSNVLGPALLALFCLSPALPALLARWLPGIRVSAFAVSMVLVVLVGASNAVRQTLANSLIQIRTAEEYHGRVMSIFNLLFNGMSRAGALVLGGIAEFSGAPWAVGGAAAVSVLLGLLMIWRMPEVRRLS